jgi:hypothetical protein
VPSDRPWRDPGNKTIFPIVSIGRERHAIGRWARIHGSARGLERRAGMIGELGHRLSGGTPERVCGVTHGIALRVRH